MTDASTFRLRDKLEAFAAEVRQERPEIPQAAIRAELEDWGVTCEGLEAMVSRS
jgi:hypothetical protein